MKKHSQETKEKISNTLKGRKLSIDRKEKISTTVKQHWKNGLYKNVDFSKSMETRQKISISVRNNGNKYIKKGEESPNWVGDNVSYPALHTWVVKNKGKASSCDFIDETCKGPFEWSNISQTYKRDLKDFQQLCRSHHNRYDRSKVLKEVL